MELTALLCKNAKPRDKAYKLNDGRGLYLEITPNEGRYWRFKYRLHGKENRISLGTFPDVSLVEAREKHRQELKLLESGVDPSLARKEEKRLASYHAAQTFETVAREWHSQYSVKWSTNHAENILRRLDLNVFPFIGHLPINLIKAPDVVSCLKKIEGRNAHEMAKRCMQICGQVMRFAIQTGRIEYNFMPDLKGCLIGHKPVSFASIEPDELPELLRAIEHNKARLYRQTILAIKLMLLTFVRTSELIEAKWNEFNFEKAEWIIPAERMKMSRVHTVPLSRQSVAILHELKALNPNREFVFPSIPRPRKPMSNNTILMGLSRLGYKHRMTGHGFRALAMSCIKEKLRYRHEVVDRQLAHVPKNAVDKAYDRAMFLTERREMMQRWADYVDMLSNC
jgi:integrase